MKKNKTEFRGIEFDSKEELEFYHWLIEAQEHELVSDFLMQEPKFELIPKKTYEETIYLKTKMKNVDKHLLYSLNYTCDYLVLFTDKFFKLFPKVVYNRDIVNGGLKATNTVLVDVKGAYNLKNQNRIMSIMQKVIQETQNAYINIVVPEKFFNQTWCPKAVMYKKNKNEKRKAYLKSKTINEVLSETT